MRFIGVRWQYGACILSVVDEDGFLQGQPDGLGAQPRVETFPMLHPLGFAARPRDPETDPLGNPLEGAACTALIARDGDDSFILPTLDPRAVEAYPELTKGGSVQYAHRADTFKSYGQFDGDGNYTLVIEYAGGKHELKIPAGSSNIEINGCAITPTGNVITKNGVDVDLHQHTSPFGPTGSPIPTPAP